MSVPTEMAAYQSFHAKAGPAIRAGDALLPPATGCPHHAAVPTRRSVTDGPFAEAAEIACGYYVFEAENLDDALALARDVPAAQNGAVEVRPTFHTFDAEWSRRSDAKWLALLLEPPAAVNTPGTPEWEAEAARHGEFAAAAGDHIVGARHCTSRRRRPRCGFATARCCSPTGRSRRAPRSPRASTCCQPPTATRRSSWRR